MRQYRLVAYIRIDPEDEEPMTYEEAQAEKKQQELLFPENIYQIDEIKPATSTDRKEDLCIPPESRRS